jgi:hypothetical protein
MGGDVKTELAGAPAIIVMTSGVCFQTRECRAGCANRDDAAVRGEAHAIGVWHRGIRASLFVRNPVRHRSQAVLSRMREPSCYQGLIGPRLLSALRRGITYSWGLKPAQTVARVQASNGCSPPIPTRLPGAARTDGANRTYDAGALSETSYEGFVVLVGSYPSFFFQTASVMAAIFLASVSFARFGLVPAARSLS